MKRVFSLLIVILLGACVLRAQNVPKMTTEQYIEKFKDIAIAEMARSRIPASITLAQGILESGSGNSRLAIAARNHFGIKCKKGWTGDTLHEDDDAPQECFRAYKTDEDSYRDHSDFLMNSARYAFLFDLQPNDYKGWASGLKKAGYATNPNYPQLITGFIEKHNLQRFDAMKPGEQEQKEIKKEKEQYVQNHTFVALKEFNGLPVVKARKGDSYTKIAVENDMMVWQVLKYNDLKHDASPEEGDTLYLKPKRSKGSTDFYEVQVGDNMYRISQRFAIKLKSLYKLNQMEFGTEAMWGEKLHLQNKRKTPPRIWTSQDQMLRPMLIPQQPTTVPQDQVKQQPAIFKPDTANHKPAFTDTIKPDTRIIQPIQPPPMPVDSSRVNEEIRKEAANRLMQLHLLPDTLNIIDTTTSFIAEKEIEVSEIPVVNIDEMAKRLDALPIAQRADSTIDNAEETFLHTVQPKETLYSIARKYKLKVADLKELNKLTSDSISIGMELVVNEHMLPQQRSQMVKTGVHVVAEKETLYGIARRYELSVDELIALNQLTNLDVKIGQQLIVLKNQQVEAPPKEAVKPAEPVYHVVLPKETLYSLSRKYSVPVEELMKLNNMSDFSLKSGQNLRIK